MPTFQLVKVEKKKGKQLIYTLDGVPLVDGEKVIVRWPDSSSSNHLIVLPSVVGMGPKVYVNHRGRSLTLDAVGEGLLLVRDV